MQVSDEDRIAAMVDMGEENLLQVQAARNLNLRETNIEVKKINLGMAEISHLHAQLNSMTTQATLIVGFAVGSIGAETLTELANDTGQFCIYKSPSARFFGFVFIIMSTACIFFCYTVITCANVIMKESNRRIFDYADTKHVVKMTQFLMYGDPRLPYGQKWRDIGTERPQSGLEIVNTRLSAALLEKNRFSGAEVAAFGLEEPLGQLWELHGRCAAPVPPLWFARLVLSGGVRITRADRPRSGRLLESPKLIEALRSRQTAFSRQGLAELRLPALGEDDYVEVDRVYYRPVIKTDDWVKSGANYFVPSDVMAFGVRRTFVVRKGVISFAFNSAFYCFFFSTASLLWLFLFTNEWVQLRYPAEATINQTGPGVDEVVWNPEVILTNHGKLAMRCTNPYAYRLSQRSDNAYGVTLTMLSTVIILACLGVPYMITKHVIRRYDPDSLRKNFRKMERLTTEGYDNV